MCISLDFCCFPGFGQPYALAPAALMINYGNSSEYSRQTWICTLQSRSPSVITCSVSYTETSSSLTIDVTAKHQYLAHGKFSHAPKPRSHAHTHSSLVTLSPKVRTRSWASSPLDLLPSQLVLCVPEVCIKVATVMLSAVWPKM